MSLPKLFLTSVAYSALVVFVTLALGGCALLGKGPRGPAYIAAIDPATQTVTLIEPVCR